MAAAYDIHQCTHDNKAYAPLQRFVWCIAVPVLQLLKPSLNCCLVNSLIRKKVDYILRKTNNGELQFSQKKAMRLALWVTLQAAKLFENRHTYLTI